MLKEIKRKVLSYCEIPGEIAKNNCSINEASCDSYIEYDVTGKVAQEKYDDDFSLDNWIISKYPELSDTKIMIHIDY